MVRLLLTLILLLAPAQSWAAITEIVLGTAASGTTSVAPSVPASGITAGDILIMCVANKPVNTTPGGGTGAGHVVPTTPSGWTAPSNNQGFGDDSASPGTNDCCGTQATLFYRIADGSETGTVTSNITNGTSAHAHIIQYRSGTASFQTPNAAQGGDSTFGTAYDTGAMSNDPGIDNNDMVVGCHAKSVGSTNTATVEAITATGVTFGTMVERYENATSLGDNVGVILTEHPVTAGPSSAAPHFTYTYGSNNIGGTVVLQLREAAAGTTPIQSGGGFIGSIIK